MAHLGRLIGVIRKMKIDLYYKAASVARNYVHRINEYRFRNQPIPESPIKGLLLAVTNICNAKCNFCAYPKTKLTRGVMSMNIAAKALNLIKDLKSVDLTPTVGDPLIDKSLVDKIKMSKILGYTTISITTNAILPLDGLIDAGITHVFFSLPSFDKENYTAIYGVDKMSDVQANMLNFVKENLDKGEPVYIKLRFRNSLKPSEILNTWFFKNCIKPLKSKKLSFNFTPDFDNWGGTIKKEDLLPNMKLSNPLKNMRSFCNAMNSVSIRWDGKVRACGCRFITTDEDDLVIGHLDDGIDVLNLKLKALLTNWKQGNKPETCKKCSFYNPRKLK